MTSKSRNDFSMNQSVRDQQEKARGSVFDRLGAKQTMSQHQQPPHYQMRSKYEVDARRKLDSVQHSSHRHNYNYHDNQYVQESNQHHHIQSDDNYYKSDRLNNPHVSSRHMIKSKINKEDYHDNQYKNEQNAESLEKKRNELKRELQKIDQREPAVSKHHHHQNTGKSSSGRRNYKTSPCSSSSDSCSSSGSGSESGSESYTSCSSSCSSSSFSDENVHRQKTYKKNISNSINQTHQRTDKFANTSSSNLMRGHTPPPIHHQPPPPQNLNRNIANKRYHQPIDLSAAKRLRSRSPQSTTSSYYSRKSNRAGPLTPPLPNSSHHSQHSLSNSNTPSSSINKLDVSSGSNVKLDRHGNVRVSLLDRERQRRDYDGKQPPQQINSPSSVHNYSKSSRSPLSRSREDLYSSYVSSSEKRKFTPSPIHHKHQQSVSPFSPHINRNKPPQHPPHDYQTNYDNNYHHNKMYDNRSNLNSSFHGHGYKQQQHPPPPPPHQLPHHQSAPSLRQNLNPMSHRGSPVFNYDNNYVSPVRDHPHYSPRPPMQMQPFHKVKEFDNNRKPNYNNRYMDYNYKGDLPPNPHQLDALGLNRPPIKRNNLNSNNKNINYSPLRTSSSLSNTHHHYPMEQQHLPFKKQPSFNNNNNIINNNVNQQPFTQLKPINQKQQNLKNLKNQLIQKQQQVIKPTKTKQSTNKLDDQGDEIEISSISNNSITEDIIEDIIEDDMQHTKILKDEENAKKEKELKSKAEKAKVDDNEDDQIEDGEMKDDDDEEEEGLIVEKTEDKKQVEHVNEKSKEDEDQNKKQIKATDETTVDSLTKNDESANAFSDENFSEWSDVEDYGNNAVDTSNLNNTEDDKSITANKVDNYDDVKFKIDELEAISDEEFDAIIDEHLENGMLSCKQVLDQLDINWASLIRDKELDESQEEKDKKQEQKSKEASAKSNFKSAQLLSQLGVSSKFSGSDLRKLIQNYCCNQLNDKNFNFESSSPIHSLANKKKRLNDDLPPSSQATNAKLELLNDAESRNTLSDINLVNRKNKIISFNHLVQSLRNRINAHSNANQDNNLSSNDKTNEETKVNQETNEFTNNVNSDSINKDELVV